MKWLYLLFILWPTSGIWIGVKLWMKYYTKMTREDLLFLLGGGIVGGPIVPLSLYLSIPKKSPVIWRKKQ